MSDLCFLDYCSFCEKRINEGQGVIVVSIGRIVEDRNHIFIADAFHLTCYQRICPTKQLKIKGVKL